MPPTQHRHDGALHWGLFGFSAVAGAMREMVGRFKYRCIALRDCTTAYEYADTVDEQVMNRAVMRHIETALGYTADGADLIAALAQADG